MLTLMSDAGSVVVTPRAGGALIGWMHGETPILRRAEPPAVFGNPHAMACFPLVPYANRIANGRFTWAGRTYALAPSSGSGPHAIHGVGRYSPWTLERAGSDIAVLSLDHAADAAWPFAFRAEVSYRLDALALTANLSITNRHAADAPAGLGLHPYFPRAHAPVLTFQASGVWINDPEMLPVRHEPIPADWSHTQGLPVGKVHLDNCFTGWDRVASIAAGPASLRIEASAAFGNLQVYTPQKAGFFCAEAVSHVPDALNRPDLPVGQAMAVLRPGETLDGTIRFILSGA